MKDEKLGKDLVLYLQISPLKAGVPATLGKIHVFITQSGNNHPEIGAKHAGKIVISSSFDVG